MSMCVCVPIRVFCYPDIFCVVGVFYTFVCFAGVKKSKATL